MNRQESEERLKGMAFELGELLGWRLVPRDDAHVLEFVSQGRQGYHVYFNAGWQGGYDKVSISGGWPRDSEGRQISPDYGTKTPRINVSVTRSAEAIAREVQKRFLPEFVPLWEKAVERVESTKRHEKDQEDAATRLARIVGVAPSEVRRGKFSLYHSSIFPESLSDVYVSGDDVKLEIRCSVEDAEAILKTLVKMAKA